MRGLRVGKHGLDRAALPADLDQFAAQAEAMARVAIAGLQVSPESLNPREKTFATTLLRHARGAAAAVAAWRQELGHQH